MSRICRIMGDSAKLPFYELDRESKMRLLNTRYSHTSKRPGYGARKTYRKVIEGNADPIRSQTTDQNLPRADGVAEAGYRT